MYLWGQESMYASTTSTSDFLRVGYWVASAVSRASSEKSDGYSVYMYTHTYVFIYTQIYIFCRLTRDQQMRKLRAHFAHRPRASAPRSADRTRAKRQTRSPRPPLLSHTLPFLIRLDRDRETAMIFAGEFQNFRISVPVKE